MHPVERADLWLIRRYKVYRWRRSVKAWSKRVMARPEVLRQLEALPRKGNRTV